MHMHELRGMEMHRWEACHETDVFRFEACESRWQPSTGIGDATDSDDADDVMVGTK